MNAQQKIQHILSTQFTDVKVSEKDRNVKFTSFGVWMRGGYKVTTDNETFYVASVRHAQQVADDEESHRRADAQAVETQNFYKANPQYHPLLRQLK